MLRRRLEGRTGTGPWRGARPGGSGGSGRGSAERQATPPSPRPPLWTAPEMGVARAAGSRWGRCERARCVHGLPPGGAEGRGWCRADGAERRRAWPPQGRGPPETSMDGGTCSRRMAMTQLRACSCRWLVGLWGCRSPRSQGGAGRGQNALDGGVPGAGSAWNLDRRARRRPGRAGRGSAGSKRCLRGRSPRRGGLSGYLYRWALRSPLEPPWLGYRVPLAPSYSAGFRFALRLRYGVVGKEGQALVRGGAHGPAVLAEGVEAARSGRYRQAQAEAALVLPLAKAGRLAGVSESPSPRR